MYGEQVAIQCVLMRGGSSKGAFLLARDLPADSHVRDRVLLAIYGSPDARQIDGIGGADPLTSKVAIVGLSTKADADVEYTFGQVGITEPRVFYGGNCGNMLAGVAPFAIDEGLVAAHEPITTVRIYNTNTRHVITAEVRVSGDKACVLGEARIPGVPGSGAGIMLDFRDCGGAMTGKLLPTGRPLDVWRIAGRNVAVSLVDATTAFVFVNAADIGLKGTELPPELQANMPAMGALEEIRGTAAMLLGLANGPDTAKAETPNVPRVAIVSPPQEYTTVDGATVLAADIDVSGRQLAMQRPHKAFAVTGSLCLSVAARIPGTVVNAVCRPPNDDALRLGHPAGSLRTEVRVVGDGGAYRVERAALERTARRIFAGTVYVPVTVFSSV
jgi:2-methylaconitate cis-trans-isomerase PrpF